MPSVNFAQHVFQKLLDGGWRGIQLTDENEVTCPGDTILKKVQDNNYQLKFIYFGGTPAAYSSREKYGSIIFPQSFGMERYIYFRSRGGYKLAYERQFKKVVNILGKECVQIKITSTGSNVRRFYGNKLVLSADVFTTAMAKAEQIHKKQSSYALSTENYLSNLAAQELGRDSRKRTTYVEKGEISFLVDRVNLETKKTSKDLEKYLNPEDIKSAEVLAEKLIRLGVFSEDFLRRLNDYFIREKLSDIILKGRQILDLGSTDLTTDKAVKIQSELELTGVRQLETLWQRYFEKYLLYLIFSYKKIFPKVELSNIDGDKKYPDFIGINHYNGLDVIEIKTHLKNALVWDRSHENFYFSPEMSKSIVQTTNYLDAISQERFRKNSDKQRITNYTDEENLYHPRGIIVISSSSRLASNRPEHADKLKRDFTKLRNSLNNIQIITFDEIINIADEYTKNIID